MRGKINALKKRENEKTGNPPKEIPPAPLSQRGGDPLRKGEENETGKGDYKPLLVVAIILVVLLSYSNCLAQQQTALTFIVESNPIQPQVKKHRIHKHRSETSEFKLLGMGLIRLYQRFISTQDMPVCNFTPSCSLFGIQAISKYGFFLGILLTSDRLQRCHGAAIQYSPRYYSFDGKTGRLFDPVENYSR